MLRRETVIRNCFHAWINKDISAFLGSFAENVVYIESWGPAYENKRQLAAWFAEWNETGRVLQWDITQFFHVGNTCICEWYFQCEWGGNVDGFQGVSIVEFNEEDEIVLLKEFQSKTPNVYPYEEM